MTKHHTRETILATALFGLSISPLHALQLEEIVITAQKRAQSLQDVPISVSAVTEEGLERAGITNTIELQKVAPSLQITKAVGGVNIFMRGIGTSSGQIPGNENSVATYVDGVYLVEAQSSLMSFPNVERIEVLKGPQGTLFGRNATGGLLHIITKDPTQEVQGSAEVSFGNYDKTGFKGYTTGGLTENLAADIAISYTDQREGFGTNIATGDDFAKGDETSVRSNWLWELENTSFRFSADYSNMDDSFGLNRQPIPGTVNGGGATYTGDFHNASFNDLSSTEAERWGASLKITHAFDNAELVSITAYRDAETMVTLDQDSSTNFIVTAPLEQFSEFFSQELHIVSETDFGLKWIAGLYYMDTTASYDPFRINGAFAGNLGPGVVSFLGNQEGDTTTQSLFAETTYDLTDATSLTTGVRWTQDERNVAYSATALVDVGGSTLVEVPVLAPGIFEDEETFEELTWRLALSHHINDDIMIYASYNRGFKSGVYNFGSIIGDLISGQLSAPVEPEILDAYEVGMKSDLTDNLRLNAAIFYYEFENLQTLAPVPGGSILVNGPEAEITGAEIDITYLPTDSLELRAAVNFQDTEYTSFPNGVGYANNPVPPGGNTQIVLDHTGNQLARTPDFAATLGATYIIEAASGTYTSGLNYYYNDGFFFDAENRVKQDSYDVLSGEVSWESTDGNWRIRLYGNNLLDEDYVLFGIAEGFGDHIAAAEPRTFGTAIRYNF